MTLNLIFLSTEEKNLLLFTYFSQNESLRKNRALLKLFEKGHYMTKLYYE